LPIEPRRIAFRNDGWDIIGHLRLPEGFDEQRRWPAIVVVGPGSSVKEQAGGTYAGKLAGKGYVTLVFDPSYQGQSLVGACKKLEGFHRHRRCRPLRYV
jgi:uncharacterized protein